MPDPNEPVQGEGRNEGRVFSPAKHEGHKELVDKQRKRDEAEPVAEGTPASVGPAPEREPDEPEPDTPEPY